MAMLRTGIGFTSRQQGATNTTWTTRRGNVAAELGVVFAGHGPEAAAPAFARHEG